MDDDVLDDHRHTDAESFGEWIEQVAESRGVSEDELLHQLMSSYWMMDELAAVIDDLEIEPGRDRQGTGGTGEGDRSAGDPDSKPDSPEREEAEGSGTDQRDPDEAAGPGDYDAGVIPLIETLKDWKAERAPPESSSVDDNLIDLIEVIQEGNQPVEPGQSATGTRDRDVTDAGGVSETVQLIRALKEFGEPNGGGNIQNQLAAAEEHRELADRVEELEAEIEAATENVQQVDQATKQRTRKVAKQVRQLDSRLDTIEESLQDKPDAAAVDQIERKLSDVADQVTKVRGEVDSRFEEVDTDFENVEQILNHLFDQADANDARTESLSEQVTELQSRMHVLDDLQAAKDLQREAHEAGVSTATCGACGEAVDVGQLTEPTCPYCRAEFDGLTEEKKWGIFRHQVLTEANPEQES